MQNNSFNGREIHTAVGTQPGKGMYIDKYTEMINESEGYTHLQWAMGSVLQSECTSLSNSAACIADLYSQHIS